MTSLRARLREVASVVLWPAYKVFGALAYLAIRALEPWRRVRVGYLENERIGHQAINTELYLRSRSLEGPETGCLDLFVSGPPANRQLHAMQSRKLQALRLPLLGMFHHRGLRPWLAGTRFEARLDLRYEDFPRVRAAAPQMAFTPEEERRGAALLESLGVSAGSPFVCFHARSADFLQAVHARPGQDWSYHDFRDCSVDNFLPAARRLARDGIYALRMGAVVDAPLEDAGPMVVDYATRHRSDFGDIFLSARCRFFIGNTAGLVCVPWVFDVPVLMTNAVPLFIPRAYGPKDLVLPKLVWDVRRERLLNFREMRDSATWNESRQFRDAGLEVRENSAEEILEAALEMSARLDGTWRPEPEDDELERRFAELIPGDPQRRGCPPRLASVFLRRHRALLDAPGRK